MIRLTVQHQDEQLHGTVRKVIDAESEGGIVDLLYAWLRSREGVEALKYPRGILIDMYEVPGT